MSITAERIQQLRQQKKLTQSELADLVGTTRVTVGRIERDINNPSIGMLSLLADALGTTMDYLQGKTDNPLKASAVDNNGDENEPLTPNQRHIAYSIDPDVSDEEREDIIKMVQLAMKHRRRI
ncbi:transcriptional regulator [Leuconostoc pseudomesenteroides]|uniref:Transcriptional regulator n=1 Tax=Leuconostoc pseudomesenteroides TaxID=33968 RepID=A0A1X0VBF0_LEUPS|nr:helix-turn-helix transcriptional regulator [Leuconostoc pseudomesenteroides]OQJ70051.1 transcriptional regulator [Leuconostoc pseudomesenteroides]OQJ74526.1 transcriptional regulator [Leuconostoc pseudomesenteroides]OQJ75598.1 transcriptional regulator [Leuconostoc pseudomesenteroides]ORI35645.1 transcriptional regulator [Leuconostoc pseudomesenteroides]ORI44019.1 transcriptional regulator [Leuconostoc pseudomesenteroides]